MKRLSKHLLLFLCLGLIFNTSVPAETKWITKKDSKTSKVKTLEQMYVDGLLSRNECIKAKKKILKSQSVPGCKKTETDEETVTYITKKETKKKKEEKKFITKKKEKKKEEKKVVKKKEKKKEEKKVVKKKVEKYVPEDIKEDNIKPKIEIANSFTFKDPEYLLKGKVIDKGGSEKFYLFVQKGEGKKKRVKMKNGRFEIPRFSLDNEEIKLIAIDEYRNETIKVVKVNIVIEEETEVASVYDELKPIIKGIRDNNRVALIIGVENYTNTPVKALYAKRDAEKFKNFANRSLGISASNIKVLIDSKAKRLDAVEALKLWLPKKITPNESELFVFFSGHGYPSEEEGLHIIPQDGDPRLLEESALSHRYIINQIKKTRPKSVTMFMDACYSGQSNTGEVLVAGLKPIFHVSTNEDIPANFNIFSSSERNSTSGTIKEAEHGIFSYYLMEGLTGKADLNKDRKITNVELFVYLQDNVSQEAFKQNQEQNPILTSQNPDQVLMKY